MLCALSGEQPEVPVASRKSGNIFEKRLIETYIAEHGTDPVNGEELSQDDLIELKTARAVLPRPPTLTSIPALLSTFQNEWDAVALETYTLKQQLAQTRQELSTALYNYDAALRVIAKLQIERNEARDALSKITVSGSAGGTDAMDVDGQGLPDSIATKVEETQARLSSTRRKRPVPEGWATADTIESFESLQATESLYPGAQALAVNPTGALVIAGGSDGVAGIYSIQKKEVVQALKISTGKVTGAVWWDSKPIITTSSGHVKVFLNVSNGGDATHLGSHAGAATGVALHPSGELLASIGVDKTYKLYDLTSLKLVSQITTPSGMFTWERTGGQTVNKADAEAEITCGEFHPDGHLFAAGGKDGKIRLYDIKSGDEAAAFEADEPIQALSFSENGTWLASVVQGQIGVSIWDLRKMSVIKVLEVGGAITSAKWDYTGQFLAVAGPSGVAVQHYAKSSKAWTEPFRKAIPASAVAWGANAGSLVALTSQGGLDVFESA